MAEWRIANNVFIADEESTDPFLVTNDLGTPTQRGLSIDLSQYTLDTESVPGQAILLPIPAPAPAP